MTEPPPLGARVRIPLGLTTREGNVVEVYDGASGPRVVVEINYSENEDPFLEFEPIRSTVVFPLSDVEIVAA